jgi:succinate dehydrogenase / fumarate reductase cytochrome b subunit
MALAGLFLVMFLFVHLFVNSLLLFDPTRELFNAGAHFMVSNPVIQFMQIFLFGGILIHILFGLILQIQNWKARPVGYKVMGWSQTSPFSKFMIHTGAIILIFLIVHMINFFLKAKTGQVEMIQYGDLEYEDMGLLVVQLFKNGGYVIFYVIAVLLMAFHLHHAFQSAFQSLGLNHSKYTPFIKGLSTVVSIVLGLGFMLIPVIIFFSDNIKV